MITKEQLQAKFVELEKEKNEILTQQIEIQGQIKLLEIQATEKAEEAKVAPTAQ